MYEKIENILVRTLSPFEYEQLEQLKKEYTEEQIINAYKNSSVKNINYIKKVLINNNNKIIPNWLNKKIENEPIDEETQQIYDDFMKFVDELRN